MIVTNNKKIYDLCTSLRNQGRGEDMQWLNHVRIGYNYRMDELSAAVGVAQMKKISTLLAERQKIAAWYTKHFSAHAKILGIPQIAPGNTHTWFVYVIQLPSSIDRDSFIKKLAKVGVASKPYLPSIHLTKVYKDTLGYTKGRYPVSERVSDRSLALPFYVGMKEADVKEIVIRLINQLP
jgi:perosamine synthetase